MQSAPFSTKNTKSRRTWEPGHGGSLSGSGPGARPGLRAQNFEYNGGSEVCVPPFSQRVQVLNRLSIRAWYVPLPGVCRDRPYFTMEYLPGKTLEKMIADRAHLGQFRASYFFALMQQWSRGWHISTRRVRCIAISNHPILWFGNRRGD